MVDVSEVLILAKTRMTEKFCVGALDLDDGRSLRLLTDKGFNQPLNAKYEVGDVWELRYRPLPPERLEAPHTEDVRVVRRRLGYKLPIPDVIDIIQQYLDVPTAQPHDLFGGMLRLTHANRARILRDGEIPQFSTSFWRLNEDLRFCEMTRDGKAKHYYRESKSAFEVPYVGIAPARDVLPAKTLLRFSLTRWFEPNPGYWLQLSGWFI